MNVARVRIAIRNFLSQKAGLLSICITDRPQYTLNNGHAISSRRWTIAVYPASTQAEAVFIDTRHPDSRLAAREGYPG